MPHFVAEMCLARRERFIPSPEPHHLAPWIPRTRPDTVFVNEILNEKCIRPLLAGMKNVSGPFWPAPLASARPLLASAPFQ